MPFVARHFGAKVLAATRRMRTWFNFQLSRRRTCVEHTFGGLKNRFPALREGLRCVTYDTRKGNNNLDHIREMVTAALVLHNIIQERDGTYIPPLGPHDPDLDPDCFQRQPRGAASAPRWLIVREGAPGPAPPPPLPSSHKDGGDAKRREIMKQVCLNPHDAL